MRVVLTGNISHFSLSHFDCVPVAITSSQTPGRSGICLDVVNEYPPGPGRIG